MSAPRRFSWALRARSVLYALRGLLDLVRQEHNARIHAVATALVCAQAWCWRVSGEDWRWLVLCIAAVWVAEAFNTALERLCDRVSLERHPLIRQAKDIAAAAVLLTCLAAVCIGGLTLWPYWVRGGFCSS